jgi:hypothetical protein
MMLPGRRLERSRQNSKKWRAEGFGLTPSWLMQEK